MARKYTPEEREAAFWSRVNKDGPVPDPAIYGDIGPCWVWTGAKTPDGYGTVWSGPKRCMRAPRLAWERAFGPATGLLVLHKCDNRACVRPTHLKTGTARENTRDMDARGRGKRPRLCGDANPARLHPDRLARGEANGARLHPERLARGEDAGSAKLTERKVVGIREMRRAGATYQEIGCAFAVSAVTARDVVVRRTWAHVP